MAMNADRIQISQRMMSDQLFGEALLNMAEPGTAYDNPIMGNAPD